MAGSTHAMEGAKSTRSLLLLGDFERRALERFESSARAAGIEMEHLAPSHEIGAWLESHDPVAIALDMAAPGAESACLLIRGIGRLAAVPIVGLAAELTDLTFPEIYGWGGDDAIR